MPTISGRVTTLPSIGWVRHGVETQQGTQKMPTIQYIDWTCITYAAGYGGPSTTDYSVLMKIYS